MQTIEQDPTFWQFLTIIWKDHPWIFVLLVFLSWGGIGAIRNGTSFLEYWINGYTPRWLKKRPRSSKKSGKNQK